jgi:uncharacterized protein VirK/YbjX
MTLKNDHPMPSEISDQRPTQKGNKGPFSLLGRQKKPWLPVLLAGISWRALTNIRTHREVVRLLKFPPFVDAVQNNPKFALKYLTEQYLVRDFTVAERAACFRNHYLRLYNELPDRLLRQILHWSVDLHEFSEGGNRFVLTMGLSRPCDKEGEMSLILQANGEIIYTLSFTIVPGWVVKSTRTQVLLISRLQGAPAYPPEKIKLITKAVYRLRFGALLLAGLEGIATAFGIEEIACVCSTRNLSYAEEYAPRFKNAYEDFFAELGITPTDAGFLSATVPIEERSLEAVKHSHKSRARTQRAIKQNIRSACADYFLRAAGQYKDSAETLAPCSDPAAIKSPACSDVFVIEDHDLTLEHEGSVLSAD